MECKHEGKRSKYDGVSLTRMGYEEAYKKGNRNFAGANLCGANLCGANLSSTVLNGANLEGANLSDANLSRADLSDANLFGANLRRANLKFANLTGAFLIDADLSDADLSDADLSGADLSSTVLNGANLTGAFLIGTNLIDADLSGANLYRANLRGANLGCAGLSGANLFGANLWGANLWGANLEFANLDRANLSRADLILTRVDGCNLNVPARVQRCEQTAAFFVGAISCLGEFIPVLDLRPIILGFIAPEDLNPALISALQHVRDTANAANGDNIAPIGFMVRNPSLALDQKQAGPARLLTHEEVYKVENQDVRDENQIDAQGDPAQDQQGLTSPTPGLFQSRASGEDSQAVAPTRGQRREEKTNECCAIL